MDNQQLSTLVNLLLTAKVGDGHIFTQKGWHDKHCARFMGTNLELISCKARLLGRSDKIYKLRQNPKAYGSKPVYYFQTKCSEEATRIKSLSYSSAIKEMGREELVVWYLDDGSFHKNKRFMHLYSNCLSEQETILLINKFSDLYGTPPRLRIDKKKDGRSFFYIYLGTELTKRFSRDVEKFLKEHDVSSLNYKIGKGESSTAIP